MADTQERRLDALPDFEGFDDDVAGGGAAVDFENLEVFDSNAAQAPYSSQAPSSFWPGSSDPMDVMPDGQSAAPSSVKSKRDKKRKKKHRPDRDGSAEDRASQRKSARKSEPVAAMDPSDLLEPEHDATPSTHDKKKRKLADSTDGKKHKKRRPHEDDNDEEAAIRETAAAVASLREGRAEGTQTQLLVDEAAAEASAQRSTSPEDGAGERSQAAEDGAYDFGGHQDMELLARVAWNEHVNGSGSNPTAEAAGSVPRAPEAAMDEAEPPNGNAAYDIPNSPEAAAEPDTSTPKRRSARAKKAKPTFYERPPAADPYPAEELPSPSAMAPRPRNRTKAASRKSKLSRSMRGGSDDDDTPRARRNKMAGFTQGRFSDDEMKQLRAGVKAFMMENGLEQSEVNDMIQAPGGTTAGDMHAQLWSRLFAECPNRHRQKVINVARKNFHNFVARGTWTLEQDEELNGLIDVHGTKWSKIAGLILRHPEDVRDRYRNYLVCGSSQRKDAWDQEEEARLTEYVMNSMAEITRIRKEEPNETVMTKTFDQLIDWQSISENMDRTRSRLQCITKWKALNIKTQAGDKLESKQPDSKISFRLEKSRRQIVAMPEEERFRLILAIKDTAVGTDAKIPWQRLVDKQFRNLWHRSTQTLLWYRLKRTIPGWETKTVRDCAQDLADQYNQTGELPAVDQEGYDDGEEMALIETVPTARKSEVGPSGRGAMSQQYVDNSGDEEEGEGEGEGEDVGEGEVGEDSVKDDGEDQVAQGEGEDDIQIDPALMEAPPSTETPKNSTPADRKTTRKTPESRKTKRTPRTTSDLSQDPIVDIDDEVEAPAAEEQGEESEIEEQKPRKKKTAGKARKGGRQPRSTAHIEESSDMDDMEDLPARAGA